MLDFSPRPKSTEVPWTREYCETFWATMGQVGNCIYVEIQTAKYGCSTKIVVYGPGKHQASAKPRQSYGKFEICNDYSVYMSSNGTMALDYQSLRELDIAVTEAIQAIHKRMQMPYIGSGKNRAKKA